MSTSLREGTLSLDRDQGRINIRIYSGSLSTEPHGHAGIENGSEIQFEDMLYRSSKLQVIHCNQTGQRREEIGATIELLPELGQNVLLYLDEGVEPIYEMNNG